MKPLPEFDTLCARYGDTVYGQYVRFCFAERTGIHRPDPQPEGWDNVTFGNYPYTESIARYTSLLEDAPDFPLADECMLNLAKAYSSLGRKAEAAQVLQELLVDFPNTVAAHEAEALLPIVQPTQ